MIIDDLVHVEQPPMAMKAIIECPFCLDTFSSTFNKNRHVTLMHEGVAKKHLKHIKKGKKYLC